MIFSPMSSIERRFSVHSPVMCLPIVKGGGGAISAYVHHVTVLT